MLGIPTVDILQRYKLFGDTLHVLEAGVIAAATQKHESGSVSHKFNPFQQMDINQIGLMGSNNTSSGSGLYNFKIIYIQL